MGDLKDNIQAKKSVFCSEEFQALPDGQQSRLLRIAAIECLLQEKHTEEAKKWLRQAWRKTPFEPKTVAVVSFSLISEGLARTFIKPGNETNLRVKMYHLSNWPFNQKAKANNIYC